MSEPKPLLAPLKPAAGMPRLWTPGGFLADPWTVLADDDALPLDGRAIVSLARWRKEQADIAGIGVTVGVAADVADVFDASADAIDRLGVIALPFAKFTDGRAYSTARRLREAQFNGQIRAMGDVLLDQLPLMLRAGFDAFVITHTATIAALEAKPVPAVSRIYQPSAERSSDGWRSRRVGA